MEKPDDNQDIKATPIEMIREDLIKTCEEFFEQSGVQVFGQQGARKAGAKSRKLSNQIGKLCKEWRKASVANDQPADDQTDEETDEQ